MNYMKKLHKLTVDELLVLLQNSKETNETISFKMYDDGSGIITTHSSDFKCVHEAFSFNHINNVNVDFNPHFSLGDNI